MAEAEENDASVASWILELESALHKNTTAESIKEIPKGIHIPQNLRATLWQVCLDVTDKSNDLNTFDEIFDLVEQDELRSDCQQLVDKLGNDEEDKVSVTSDLESVLTCYCKRFSLKYQSDNGWLEILAALIPLKLSRDKLYNCFHAIKSKYIPRNTCQSEELLRLLILYHDPELCSILDSKKVTPGLYCDTWFRSLFAAICDLKVTQFMWDAYFRTENPFFLFFLALVIIINAKEQIVTESKKDIIDFLTQAPASLEANDIEDFCSLAQFYSTRTPQSFRKEYYHLFEDGLGKDEPISQSLCLPVTIDEMIQVELGNDNGVRFFVVDCRPAEQYNNGHLATAFHLDASLMLQEPQAFATATSALLTAQQQALAAGSVAAGEHLCFLGSGREDEDQYVMMVVASFLQKHTQHVSVAKGGYLELHELIKENLSLELSDHVPKNCIACNLPAESNDCDEDDFQKDTLFNRFSSALQKKTAEVTEKLVDFIHNTHNSQPPDRHVSSKDRLGKRYRNTASVFTIDDDQEGDADETASDNEVRNVVNINSWLKENKVINWYQCHHITENGMMYPSRLVVTDNYLYIIREVSEKNDSPQIIKRRELQTIMKITSKRKEPEFITFKYGTPSGEDYNIIDIDRLLIPKAGDATKLIKQQICSSFVT